MLRQYEKFLKIFDEHLNELFKMQEQYIKCQKGCSQCCEKGDYPFSRLEMEYLMQGFINLPENTKHIIRENIADTKGKKEYRCPFLINKLCSLYKYRGLVCRTHGLGYLSDGKIKLPECTNNGLNYSNVYDKSTGEIFIQNPVRENLRIDEIFNSPLARQFTLEKGEIRRLADWFDKQPL